MLTSGLRREGTYSAIFPLSLTRMSCLPPGGEEILTKPEGADAASEVSIVTSVCPAEEKLMRLFVPLRVAQNVSLDAGTMPQPFCTLGSVKLALKGTSPERFVCVK